MRNEDEDEGGDEGPALRDKKQLDMTQDRMTFIHGSQETWEARKKKKKNTMLDSQGTNTTQL